MNNKKVIGVLVLVIILISSFFYFQSEKEKKQERLVLQDFIKEHNVSIEMGADLDENISILQKEKKDFSTDESNSIEEPIEKEEASFEDIEVKPYTKELPLLPDEEENNSTLYGVDSNGNGVRDDLEIAIVKEFGDDSVRTEYMLASFRYRQRIFELAERGVDDDVYQYLFSRANTLSSCAVTGAGFSDTDEEFEDFSKKDTYLEKEIFFNTPERKFADKKARNNMRSFFGGKGGRNLERCQRYSKESFSDLKKDMYNLDNWLDR